MRKITLTQVLVFAAFVTFALALAIATTAFALGRAPLGDFRGLVLFAAAIFFTYVYAVLFYRLFLTWSPLRPGEIPERSPQEFVYHVYLLFYLVLFYPLMRSGFVPVPLMRVFYQALGARLGPNTYSAGIIYDPGFVEIGANVIVGQYALLMPHVIERRRLAHYPIRIGDNVTIGAHAIVLADVTIEDNAIVAAGALVNKGTYIRRGEVWGGVPARRLEPSAGEAAH